MKAWIRALRPFTPNPVGESPAPREPARSTAMTRARLVIAVAACFLGAGVATLGGHDEPSQSAHGKHVSAIVRGISPRAVEKTFNPKTTRGLKVAKVAFQFTYRHEARLLEQVRDRIEQRWNALESATLRVLKRRTPEELRTDEGLDRLADELRRAADSTLFADGIASVEDILWQQVIVQ